MHLSTLILAPLALCASLASAADMEKRSGPSGYVITPPGGMTVEALKGYPTGVVDFQYATVYTARQKNCGKGPIGCVLNTLSVSVGLRDASGHVTMLAESLAPETLKGNIKASLAVPANYCGAYNLIVKETQNAYGSLYTFQSAAPKINVKCVSD